MTTPPHNEQDPAGSPLAIPYLSVVTINYCQWHNTDRVTRQLLKANVIEQGGAEIIIVDNDSPPSPVIAPLQQLPHVVMKLFPTNTGFAFAANEGCRLARSPWVLLLNPDTSIPEGFLDQLAAQCRIIERDDPNAGVIGLALRHDDGSKQPSAGSLPTLFSTLFGLFRPRQVRKCRVVATDHRVHVPWVTGCGMLIRRECWADIGGFDEAFFLYYEDVDFCRRAWERDWSVCFEPTIHLTHGKPLHVRQVPPELRLLTRHALLTYARKHWDRWQAKVMAGVVWCEGLARQTAQRFAGHSSDMHAELRRLATDWLFNQPRAAQARVTRTSQRLSTCAGREDDTSAQPS